MNISNLGLMLTLFTTLILTSCQVKEKSGGGLVSGHVQTSNKFTLEPPATKTFAVGETVSIDVTFPFDIISNVSGGNPRLRLKVGSNTRYGTYVAGADGKTLTFRYTFQSNDNDTDGIEVLALELNGSTLQFDNKGTLTNCDVATVTAKRFSGVKVDTVGPVPSTFLLKTLPGYYNLNEKITFWLTFNETVLVTGSPRIGFNLGGTSVQASYVSGSGTKTLIFEYTITASVSDTSGGFDSINSSVTLNGGTLKDSRNNNATLSYSNTAALAASLNVKVNGSYPYIVDVNFPNNGSYGAGENLEFVFEFDRIVNVTGVPTFAITIGSTVRNVQYSGGSGTKFLTFTYNIVLGDYSTNGISVASGLTQVLGSDIRDSVSPFAGFFTDPGNNNYNVPNTSGILLTAIQPMAISVTRNADLTSAVSGTALDNTWIINQDLYVSVGFNTNVYVDQTNGVPSVSMTVGSTNRQATYYSGHGTSTLVFKYTIQEGDSDTDGVALVGILLNSGVIANSHNTNILLTLPLAILTNTKVDGIRPVISSITKPSDGVYSTVAPLNQSSMSFVVNWSEAVHLSTTTSGSAVVAMDVGGTSVPLQYVSGNDSAVITHRPASLASRNDSDGVTITSPLTGTATITDIAGNLAQVFTFSPPTTTGITVDTTAPTVTSIIPITANGIYHAGDYLDFSVTFSESVTVLIAGGRPSIPITIGATARTLVPTANGTGTNHTFRYTIVAGETDTNGVVVGTAITHNGTTAYARDAGRNNSAGTFTSPNTTGILVDSAAPTVSSVVTRVNGSATTTGTWEAGDVLSITVTYNEAVTVNTSGGTPRISVLIGSNTRYLNYTSGSGSAAIVFEYTLTSSDLDLNGLPTLNTISLNGGTMEDAGTNAAPTAFTAQNLSNMFVTYPNTRLWVQNNFVSKARTGSPSVSNGGISTTIACGSSTCRNFNGDDSLTLGGALNNVETIFIVFRNPSSVVTAHDIFSTGIQLVDDLVNTKFDLTTYSATISLDGSAGSGTIHDVDMDPGVAGSVHILQVDFDSPQSFSAGTLINSSFDGGIGEIMAISGTLTPSQKSDILTFLNSKY